MSLIRLQVVAEGRTEQEFVRTTLANHLGQYGISTVARCALTSSQSSRKYTGGVSSYGKLRNDIIKWLKEDSGHDARFTTMVDLYALPTDFPQYEISRTIADPYMRVSMLENAMASDIGEPRFIPYIQLHEFEALLFVDPMKLCDEYFDDEYVQKARELVDQKAKLPSRNPELIDGGNTTAPSKRIIQCIPPYQYNKAISGPRVAAAIGLQALRAACSHFNEWLNKLEALQQQIA
ncbi:MAG: DUF4276 family protein [Armatimonadota bacterium]